jgi:hypothetical protein
VGTVPGPYAANAKGLTARQAARDFPQLVNDVTVHELVCGLPEVGGRAPCLTCRRGVAQARGCCRTCYLRHRLAVARSETTWDGLAREGRVAPQRTREGKAS